jgi:putative DNA-invertase from lambdoid prophage Rac
MKKKRAAIYIRVSTGEQNHANQVPDLQAMAKRLKCRVVNIYHEKVSAHARRPAFGEMLKDARAGKFEALLVWSINLNTILELDSLGVHVQSHREPWLDNQGPVRPLLIAIFSWVAEQEHHQISERTKAGQADARAAGRYTGLPSSLIPLVKFRKLVAQGLTIRELAEEFKRSKTTIWKLVRAQGLTLKHQKIGVTHPDNFQRLTAFH